MQRAIYFGDSIFESIHVLDKKPLLVQRHFNRLVKSAIVLKYQLPKGLTADKFVSEILHAIEISKIKNKKNCRVRFTLYRDGAGLYLPITDISKYIIDVYDMNNVFYSQDLNKKNIVGIYAENYKACSPLSNIKTGNALVYVMASIWAKQNGYNDALIVNQYGNIIEASSSNIFWIKNNITYTPPLSEGCIAGVMREEIISVENIVEKPCKHLDLMQADEIFLTNAIFKKKYCSFK